MPNRPEFSGPPAPQHQTKACLLLSRSPSPMRHARPVIRRTLGLDFSASTQSIRDRQPSRLSRWAAFSGFCGTLPVAGTGTNVTQIGMAPDVTGQWNFHGRAVTEQDPGDGGPDICWWDGSAYPPSFLSPTVRRRGVCWEAQQMQPKGVGHARQELFSRELPRGCRKSLVPKSASRQAGLKTFRHPPGSPCSETAGYLGSTPAGPTPALAWALWT
jgi:hypothetical protein